MEKLKSNLASADFVFWKWTPNSEGLCPIKLRVTYKDVRRHYAVTHKGERLFLRESAWDAIQDHKTGVRGHNKEVRETIVSLKDRVKRAIDKTVTGNRPFTWEKFESEFLLNESGKGFLSMFADHLEVIRSENRTGTHKAYNNAYQAFKLFRKDKELSPFDVTPKMLKDFESFLENRHCGKTTIGMYARSLKVIYNLAADENPALLENYPFARKQNDRNRYKIKTGSGHKGDALTLEQLQKFTALETNPGLPEHEAKLLWLFSFHCQGMNMKDVSLLRYQDIRGETIRYVRAKTKDTEAKEAVIEIQLTDDIRKIISQIGNPDKKSTSYVFPIIPNGLASTVKRRTDKDKSHAERIAEIIQQKTKMINTRLKALCEGNDLPVITTYWSRHTYATLLKAFGESVEFIKEQLGHADVKTTENYLKRFDSDRKKKASEKISNLLKTA